MIEKLRWGILGTGNIANKFAEGLLLLEDAELLAVGSRNQSTADSFGLQFNVPRCYGTYEDLATDQDLDVIYISTPHNLHKENTLLCLSAGKHVLCEKPFAINAGEAREMVRYARENRLFLMDAMWTRYFPLIDDLRSLLQEDAIGTPKILTADFGFKAPYNPENRMFNPYLGGGALLDAGVYPVSLASMIFGTPNKITGFTLIGKTGVDEYSTMLFKYENKQMASLYTSIRLTTPQEAVLLGNRGKILIHAPWWHPSKLTVHLYDQDDRIIQRAYKGTGYHFEAIEVMSCIRHGELESKLMPLDESLSIMETMDTLRSQWNLIYPME